MPSTPGGLEEPEQGRQVITAVVVHLDQEGKAGTTGVPDSQQDPADQPEPILQAAAIGILPVVPPEVQEAGEQIIVGTVDLDPIKARHLGRPGRMAELFHQPVQQLGREIAGGEGRPPVDAGARLPAAVADLGNEQGPVLVDPLGGQREEGGVRLLIQHRLPLICPLVPVHRQVARDDDAHSTPASASRESTQAGVICPLGSERCSLVAERTVLFLDMSGPSSAVSNSE